MKSSTTKTATRKSRKRAGTKLAGAALKTCPVGGAGWCPYPFSPAQLEKKLKARANQELVTSGQSSTKAK